MNRLVFIEKGQAVTDSLTVAEVFGKEHNKVLRDIRTQMEYAGEEFSLSNFGQRTYQNSRNQEMPKIDMTEDAFALVVMSYNTKEAVQMKIKFIQEFKRIKEQLHRQFAVPTSFAEALRLAADLQEENERNKPKVEAHDKFISGENYQKVGQVAKVLGIGRNKLFAFLRENKIFMGDNTPYQQFIDRGYFVVKEKPIEMGSQVINKPQTYVTAKGVDYIHKLLGKKTA
ncbi:Rha family transcriptional regulator [Cytobacillus solani]|uniref:Rha family transcriptional regulator n=1 Tax=Cytobacillus solani TaxID=1637975 RepID=UPI0009E9E29D|nr:phage antirepressor KilAC domain-containing protein [Cytobacillus solani]